jgi:antitoxin component of RelBE/YafQ-DinJ toxin-antitoxin module
MSNAQLNIKLDSKRKKQIQVFAENYGLSLGDLMRLFVYYCLRTKDVSFLLRDDDADTYGDDTDPNLTGTQLAKNLLADGWDSKRAKQHGEAYDRMLQAEKDDTLIEL